MFFASLKSMCYPQMPNVILKNTECDRTKCFALPLQASHLSSSSSYGWCSRSGMTDIACRTLTQPRRSTKPKPKLFGAILGLGYQSLEDNNLNADLVDIDDNTEELHAECSLDVGGVVCRADERGLEICPDIEYMVKCDCKWKGKQAWLKSFLKQY